MSVVIVMVTGRIELRIQASFVLLQDLRALGQSEISEPEGHTGITRQCCFSSQEKELLVDLQRQNVLSVDMQLSVLNPLPNDYGKKVAGSTR